MAGRDNRPNFLKWRLWVLVAVGGTAGAAARETLTLLTPNAAYVPLTIALINIVGAFLLGFLYESLTRPGLATEKASRLRLLLGTGFCGGFTTYSSLAAFTAVLGSSGNPGTALLYIFGTVILGACATWIGIFAGSRAAAASPEGRP